jgi:hypothetical protein
VISEHLLEFDAPRRVQHFGESFRKLRLDRVEFLQLAPVYLAKSVNVFMCSLLGAASSYPSGTPHEESEGPFKLLHDASASKPNETSAQC